MVAPDAKKATWTHRDTSWEELGVRTLPNGIRSARFTLGDEDDPTAPMVFMAYFPPGCRVAPHTHEADYTEIILEGSQQVGRRWYHSGDIRVVRGGQYYGPLVAGPEGARVIVIFRDSRWPPVTRRTGSTEGLYVDELMAAAPAAAPAADPAR